MPSPTTSKLPIPRSWEEFEDICADVLKRIWQDPYVTRNGRTGQAQNGVDIFGCPKHLNAQATTPVFAVAQCKAVEALSLDEVKTEVTKAERFAPVPAEYLLLTTLSRDVSLQAAVRETSWPFSVRLMFWEDLSLELSGHSDLLKKHFPAWATASVGAQDVISRVLASKPEDYIYDDEVGVFLHRHDVKLRIIFDRTEDARIKFDEPWVRQFANPNATRQIVYIEYDSARIQTLYFVYVDGFRYIVPFPRTQADLRISKAQYHLGCILSHPIYGYSYDEGLRRAGIVVDDALESAATIG
jgi:hypothetical protein